VSWRYIGDQSHIYSGYLMAVDGGEQTLVAEPGEVYELRPAYGTETVIPADDEAGMPEQRVPLPVPPDDGRWVEAPELVDERPAAEPPTKTTAKPAAKTTGQEG
jgi:hypothetical protein